jgi:zinc dependent phospholipase C
MRKLRALIPWTLPLAIYSADALAWGLYTHVYFAQLLIWAIPLADPRFRRAVQRFPELLLAGACLPDTALMSRIAGAPELNTTHQWSGARRMLAGAEDDEALALAVGYASHLLTDIIAHNHFVPAHEGLWFDYPVLTHAACEWAMDAHVAPQLFALPGDLLTRYRSRLACHAAVFLRCPRRAAARALTCLGNGERFLRATCVPHAVRRGARALDKRTSRRFDYYAAETARRLTQINRLIAGDAPAWNPELDRSRDPRGRPLPRDLFQAELVPLADQH